MRDFWVNYPFLLISCHRRSKQVQHEGITGWNATHNTWIYEENDSQNDSATKTALLLKLFQGLISSSREIRAPFLAWSGNTKSFFLVPGTKLLPVYDRASCIVLHRIGGQDYSNPLPFPKSTVSQWIWNRANICIGGNGILAWD